jgi:hypothetical protein
MAGKQGGNGELARGPIAHTSQRLAEDSGREVFLLAFCGVSEPFALIV